MSEERRISVLQDRHLALGATLDDWNDMDVAQSYASDACDEHDAVRTTAGLFDVSALKKFHVTGPDAAAVVDHLSTRTMDRIEPGKSAYGLVLNDEGMICDDVIIANEGDGEYLVVHGGGGTTERLLESAEGKDVNVELDDDMHNISLQGPASVDFLNQRTPMDLAALEYFHQQPTKLFGHDCVLSRTGYSGERGYEIFASASVVGDLWDNILGEGESLGIVPASFDCLDKIRVEAALLFYPYDMNEETTPWEVGLGWTMGKQGGYRGFDAAMASRGSERFQLAGIVADIDESLVGSERLMYNGNDVGVVNSPVYSHRLGKSIAMVHLSPEAAAVGTALQVEGDTACTATVTPIPFNDPAKKATHA